jgi:anti-sigma B factor antagonist
VASDGLRLTVAGGSGERTVAAVGELDLATADAFAAALRDHLAGGPVLLDLREVSFMDSSGVRVLDALLRDVAREGWSLAVRPEMQNSVRMVLEMTGMIDALPLRESSE